MKIALTGNPNSGKTTMYNALTGRNEKVGNWAGVTVKKNEHPVKRMYQTGCEPLIVVDLPGAYSMSPFTGEESITRDYVMNEAPDVIVNIVDATNLKRGLFFTTQLLELGIPVVVALNKSDINKKRETVIRGDKLAKRLGCPVVHTVSTSSDGLKNVVEAAVGRRHVVQNSPYRQRNIDLTDRQAVAEADRERFALVDTLVNEVEVRNERLSLSPVVDKIDALLANRFLGIPFFAVVMFFVFQISQSWVGPYLADALVSWLTMFQEWVAAAVSGASPILQSFLIDGIIGGVIAVVGFLPLVMVMYFLIALLEDCGYMSRVAVVLDPIFKKVGLSGKSVIPFVIGIGCAIPGIMACRALRDERERRATAMLTPFMPCGAKIPVIALFAGAFFDDAGWVSTLMYFMGIVLIFFGALLVNGIVGYRAQNAYFIIELPDYKFPDLWNAIKTMCSRGWSYVVKAGTVILVCNFAVHILQSFTWDFRFLDYNSIIDGAYAHLASLEQAGTPLVGKALESFWSATNSRVAQLASQSILSHIAHPFALLLAPVVGVTAWQLAAATITGFIAKENVVGTLAVCFAIPNLIHTGELALVGDTTLVANTFGITPVAALAFLMFNLFSPPCFAAIGAMRAEMKSTKWLFGGIALQLFMGFTVSYSIYTVGTLLTNPSELPVVGAVAGLAAVLVMVGVVTHMILRANRNLKERERHNG